MATRTYGEVGRGREGFGKTRIGQDIAKKLPFLL